MFRWQVGSSVSPREKKKREFMLGYSTLRLGDFHQESPRHEGFLFQRGFSSWQINRLLTGKKLCGDGQTYLRFSE